MQIEGNRTTQARAQKLVLSKNQIKILYYIAKKGPSILEQTYRDLKIPKPTCGYHYKQLENYGLLIVVGRLGREKPRGLTELGEDVVKLLRGETISDEHKLELTALGIVVSLGMKMLTKEEIKRVIELFKEYLEEGKKPSDAEMRRMVA